MFLRRSNTEKTDEELLKRYQSTQNLEWLSALYLRYASLVYAVCLKYLKDRDDAKDAVMQIHEKLITSLLQHNVSNFKSWLYVNARNHCLMQLRSQKGKIKEEISPFLMETGPGSHLEDEPDMENNISRLEKCIETLAGPQQACVKLFYLQEKCYREVADETGFDLGQVKSYIQNGKRNLKTCMEANGG
ncbi:MAG TPA: sigma-70 family RNA polymerase sigma factor [Cyclobacteriaceae bacterium]|nr:sigma-70 family RNA polymerase sigma factor [Cyclobacteriaceae bacterium]